MRGKRNKSGNESAGNEILGDRGACTIY